MNESETFRAERIRKAFAEAVESGSVLAFTGNTSDVFVTREAVTRLDYLIGVISAEHNMPTLKYSLGQSAVAANVPNGPEARIPKGIDAATPITMALDALFAHINTAGAPHTLLIDFAEAVLPEGEACCGADDRRIMEQILSRSTDVSWKKQGHCLVLIARADGINKRLFHMPGIVEHTVSLPPMHERSAAISRFAQSRTHPLRLASDTDGERFARLSGGISLDAVNRLRHRSGEENPITLEDLIALKKDVIRRSAGDCLFIHEESRDIEHDIAGLPQVRRYMADKEKIGCNTLRMLLAGPPGTGKTLVGVAIALRMGTVPLSFRMIKNRYVGDSERNLYRALDVINNSAPCTVIIDECDQSGMGKRARSTADESSAVEGSLRGILMEWLGDTGANNGINVIALTNHPSGMDGAFLDRLDIIPVLEPSSAREKADIARIQAQRIGVDMDYDGCVRAFAENDGTYSGRQIVRILESARVFAGYADHDRIEYEDVRDALADTLQAYGTAEELQALLAIQYARSARYLPWVAARHYGEDVRPPAYAAPFIKNGSEIDREALERHIAERGAYAR
jgi:DNA polymerase III delta prime subunit